MNERAPSKCDTCPVSMVHNQEIEECTTEVDSIIHYLVSDKPEEKIAVFQEALRSMGVRDTTVEAVQELAPKERARLDQKREILERHVSALSSIDNNMREDCKGPLAMRAVRNSIEHTVRICTSPNTPTFGQNVQLSQVEKRELPEN